MYDFWFTMGAAIIKPALLDAIVNAKPAFDFLQRITVEIEDGVPVLLPKGPNTGVLENASTTNVREAIAKFVRNFSSSAPPIGIYCAGRFCQLVQIPFFDPAQSQNSAFKDILKLANTAYLTAVGAGPDSKLPTFPAFLGLCLMDGNLIHDFAQPTPKLIEAVSEFGITVDAANREWQIATAFVKTAEFDRAANLLMASPGNPWASHVTLEQIYFWPGFSEHAIP